MHRCPSILPSPLGLTSAVFRERALEARVPLDHAVAAYRAFFRGESEHWRGVVPEPTHVHESESPEGVVRKFLLPVPGRAKAPKGGEGSRLRVLEDEASALETESVIIPMRTRGGLSHTLCVSSQIGCAMGCGFCETAQMGLIRSLTVEEIVAQWWVARHHLDAPVRNIVFMGMGEPLDNPEGVLGAIEVLTDQHGPSLAMRRITVSTVGRLDGLAMLAERVRTPGWKQLNLAVSVNAPNDTIRDTIMPINRGMPLSELVRMMEEWPLSTGKAICAEYVLIPGVNDADEHADELADRLKNVRCCVNVIPYNPRRDSPWPAPEEADVERFLKRLESRGQFCKRRRTKGRDTMAACGQLGNEKIRNRRYVAAQA
jgi:23S rRNA (adenine2503-C2)-methyltransferase